MTGYINNTPYDINKGETILQFIERNTGKRPPTLCDAPNLESFGSCRVCSVDVALEQDGKPKAMASCHSPINDGFYI